MRSRILTIFAATAAGLAAIAACAGDADNDTSAVPEPAEPTPDATAVVDAGVDARRSDLLDGAGDDGSEDGDTGPSFTQIYTTIIVPNCAPCHTTPEGIGTQVGQLDMTTQDAAYVNLVDADARGASCAGDGKHVVPGDAAASLLFLKIDLTDLAPCGSKMPLGLPALTQEQVNEVRDWINGGARDD